MIIKDVYSGAKLYLTKTKLSENKTPLLVGDTQSYAILADLQYGRGMVGLFPLNNFEQRTKGKPWIYLYYNLTSGAPYIGCHNFDKKTAAKILKAAIAAVKGAKKKKK